VNTVLKGKKEKIKHRSSCARMWEKNFFFSSTQEKKKVTCKEKKMSALIVHLKGAACVLGNNKKKECVLAGNVKVEKTIRIRTEKGKGSTAFQFKLHSYQRRRA